MDILDRLAPQLTLRELTVMVSRIQELWELEWQVTVEEALVNEAVAENDIDKLAYAQRRLDDAHIRLHEYAKCIIAQMEREITYRENA